MNKQQKKATKAQQPKAQNKAKKPVQKQPKRTKMTKASKPTPMSLSTPLIQQQQRSFMTAPQQQLNLFKKSTSLSSTSASPLATSTTAYVLPAFTSTQMYQPMSLAPFHIAKRGLILKPKTPLDKEVDLLMDFNVLKEAKPIVELPDAEYPAWLWHVADPQQSLYDISKIPQDEMTIPTMRRKFKLERRELIKGNNNTTKK